MAEFTFDYWAKLNDTDSEAASASLARGSSPIRLLVVTGGHEFDAGFWEIFEN